MKMQEYSSLIDDFSKQYLDALLEPNNLAASTLVKETLTKQPSAIQVYKGIELAMHRIAELWQKNQISLADEHVATAITQECLIYCYEHILLNIKNNGRSVISFTVEEELHDVGINMVNHLLEYHGFDVTYLGNNLSHRDACSYLLKNKPEIIAISMSLYTHFPQMQQMTHYIKNEPELSHSKIIIGGYGFRHNKGLLNAIQYDYYAGNIDELLYVLKSL
jgi:methanogenic corrinoid protein MtbC1